MCEASSVVFLAPRQQPQYKKTQLLRGVTERAARCTREARPKLARAVRRHGGATELFKLIARFAAPPGGGARPF
jgi:hypothetical protein